MTKLLKTAFLAVTLAFSTQAAQAQSAYSFYGARFTHEPTGYRVVSSPRANGALLIRGKKQTGETFRLIVDRTGHVTGTYEGKLIDYTLAEETKRQIALNN